MTSVNVPGKVMLSGEYAVLHGAAATMLPVARQLEAREFSGTDVDAYTKVVRAAVDYPIAELEQYEKDHGELELEIDSAQFFHESDGTRTKLGLGLSAAEAVGVVALRFERAGLRWDDNIEKIVAYAEHIHRHVQGEIGSGADIAVCALRQPILFRRDASGVDIDAAEYSSLSTTLKLVWTGVPADTREMVTMFEAWLKNGGAQAEGRLASLIESADNLAQLWFDSPIDELIDAVDLFVSRMSDCAEAAKIQYRLPVHDELDAWARKHGGRAKPTGAGGGDMVLLIGDVPINELGRLVIPLNK